MTGMSVADMTGVAYLLYVISGVFGVSAVVLFFLFDITKCWRLVSKKRVVHDERQNTCRRMPTNTQTKKLRVLAMKQSEYVPATETVLLDHEVEHKYKQQETVLLDSQEYRNLTKI